MTVACTAHGTPKEVYVRALGPARSAASKSRARGARATPTLKMEIHVRNAHLADAVASSETPSRRARYLLDAGQFREVGLPQCLAGVDLVGERGHRFRFAARDPAERRVLSETRCKQRVPFGIVLFV